MRVLSRIPAAGRRAWLLGALLLIVPPLVDLALGPSVVKAVRLYGNDPPAVVTLPNFIPLPDNAAMTYQLDIVRADGWPVAVAHVVADDCARTIIANNVPVPLAEGKGCAYPAEFSVDLSRQLHAGHNMVSLTVWNRTGPSGLGLSLSALPPWLLTAARTVGLATLACAAFITAGGLRRFGPLVNAMVFMDFCLAFLRYFTTTYAQYTYDLGGHLDYIRSLALRHALPEPFGWQSQHPPLYHLLGAVFY